MYKFILNQKECISEHQIVDAEYVKRFASENFLPPPKFYKLYLKTTRRDFHEIFDNEKLDLNDPSYFEFILTDGQMATGG